MDTTEKQGEDLQECAAILEAGVRELVKEGGAERLLFEQWLRAVQRELARLDEYAWIDEVDEWFPEPDGEAHAVTGAGGCLAASRAVVAFRFLASALCKLSL
ncbi:MAG: hypothetical protein M5U25_11410 [Planctomycetota bacterium]|nr:hypothetical protein [Planctomycetota bacterium]